MVNEFWMFVFVILGHWVVSDFVYQSHWMATNKSKNWLALTARVAVYTIMMTGLMTLYLTAGTALMLFMGITFVTHFITDAITSRITSAHHFFVVVGFDQFIHYVTLIGTILWLTM